MACGAPSAHAEYPERPIKFIAATTPGGMADLAARIVGAAMAKILNQTIVIENKPGAEQIIGMEFVAKGQPADGYTAIVIGIDGQALLPLTKKGLRFDPITDLTLVAGLGDTRGALVGPATAPFQNFKELLEAVKANPGKMNYGETGAQNRYPSQAVLDALNLKATPVPFAGAAPVYMAVSSGTVDWVFIGESNATTLKPRVRLYALTGSGRSTLNPEVPTFAELGFSKVLGPAYALGVRSGTPAAIAEKLTAAAAAALALPEVKAAAQKVLLDLAFQNAEGARRQMMERYQLYQDYAKRRGLE